MGTCYKKMDILKEQIKKRHKIENFRSKENQELRDTELKKMQVNFLHQAYRYRGKANYRDFLYFYHCKHDDRLNCFFEDLNIVSKKFLIMGLGYIARKIKNAGINNIIEINIKNIK